MHAPGHPSCLAVHISAPAAGKSTLLHARCATHSGTETEREALRKHISGIIYAVWVKLVKVTSTICFRVPCMLSLGNDL